MTQPLHYTPKAIQALLNVPPSAPPGAIAGFRYLVSKLRAAQVFVLADHGQLLERDRPRPEVAGDIFRPPFPVVALEYTAQAEQWTDGFYASERCSKRIALAWEWQDDMPPELAVWQRRTMSPGVVVASIAFYDSKQTWVPVAAGMHIPFEDPWREQGPPTPFLQAALASGRIKQAVTKQRALATTPIALIPEAVSAVMAARGGVVGALDIFGADTMDEVNAYTDLCYALACKNVTARENRAPTSLNKQRLKAGKLPLKGFHVLELSGGAEMPGIGGSAGPRSGPRSHLRRGHIRRLPGERVTWVNSTVVRGRGFVDKVYAA
jgi:hypothetical protein